MIKLDIRSIWGNKSLWFVSLFIIGVVLIFWHSSDKPVTEGNKTEEAKNDDSKKDIDSPLQSTNEAATVQNPIKRKCLYYKNGIGVIESTVQTNKNGYVIENYTLENGKTGRHVIPPEPIFTNPSDQIIALALSTEPGSPMPPLPDLTGIDKDFIDSLSTPIQIKETDSEKVKELKKKVIETRKALAERVRDGESVQEALVAHQAEMDRLSNSRLMAIREMQHINKEDGLAAAQEFARKVNEKFSKEGIPSIPIIGEQK